MTKHKQRKYKKINKMYKQIHRRTENEGKINYMDLTIYHHHCHHPSRFRPMACSGSEVYF
jgi:hypothetical protein